MPFLLEDAMPLSPNTVQGSITTTNATPATGIVAASALQTGMCGLQITGTFTATIDFEATIDGSTWFAVNGFAVGTGAVATSATAAGKWQIPSAGFSQVRASCSAFTSGPAVVTWNLSQGNCQITTAAGGTLVDTELAAAVAASDTMANPTTAPVIAFNAGWDGTQWQRLRVAPVSGAILGDSANILASNLRVFDGTNWSATAAPAWLGDGTTGLKFLSTQSYLWNGATYDRWPGSASLGGKANLTAGEAHACQVGSNGTLVQATLNGASPTIAAAGDYAANDVFSEDAATGHAWLFTGLARVSGGTGIVTRAIVNCSVEAMTARLRVWLFNSLPTASTLNDNAAFSLDLDDRTKVIGYFDFPALADAGEVSYAQNLDVRLAFQAVGSANIYAIVQTLDAITNESAGMTMRLELQAIQD